MSAPLPVGSKKFIVYKGPLTSGRIMYKSTDVRVNLAIQTVKHYVESGKTPHCPENLPDDLKIRAGVFISIKKDKRLRGCIGSVMPQTSNLAKEIIQNSVSAASRDPRFSPVGKSEFEELTFSVDVLTLPEKIRSIDKLDCKLYGVILKNGKQQGVLLPNLEGVNTVKDQIQICREKAGLKPEDPFEIFRFESKRYK